MTNTNTITTIIKEAFAPHAEVTTSVIRERLIVSTEGIATPLLTVKNFEFLAELHPLTMAMAIGAKLRESIAFHIEGKTPSFNPKVQTTEMRKAYNLAYKLENATGNKYKVTFSGNTLTVLELSTQWGISEDGEPYGIDVVEPACTMFDYFTCAVDEYDNIVADLIGELSNHEDPFASASTMSFDEMMAEEYASQQQAIYMECADPFAGGVAVDEDNLPF